MLTLSTVSINVPKQYFFGIEMGQYASFGIICSYDILTGTGVLCFDSFNYKNSELYYNLDGTPKLPETAHYMLQYSNFKDSHVTHRCCEKGNSQIKVGMPVMYVLKCVGWKDDYNIWYNECMLVRIQNQRQNDDDVWNKILQKNRNRLDVLYSNFKNNFKN